jgi:hypothetical protein
MNGIRFKQLIGSCAVLMTIILCIGGTAAAQAPDHPVITEVFQEPSGMGGPVGRIPSDAHQEYIELYLPPLSDLAASLNKDALNLTFYEADGDSSSPSLTRVNYRIDLPTFDLDPSNGLTGLPRPSSGIVVLGWVDYVGNPPTDLAGTPSTRVALVNHGVTSTTDYTFIAINGGQFSGTTNFPIPVAISHLDLVSDPLTGKIEQGSSVYLLVNRDDPGYAEVCGVTDPAVCNDFPDLSGGTILGVSSLLDGFAGNDDTDFVVEDQPTDAGDGTVIDHEFLLPIGGAFTLSVPQVDEEFDGYQRRFVDVVKTTEDGIANNENPALDAVNGYLTVSNLGPFSPTPGAAPSSTSAAALEVASPNVQRFVVLTDTLASPGLLAANRGGDFGMNISAIPGPSNNPSVMILSSGTSSFGPLGQTSIDPTVSVETFADTPHGHTQIVGVAVAATQADPLDPAVEDPFEIAVAFYTAINPTTGLDAQLQPFQATSFLAIQGLPDEPGIANEFAATSLGQLMATELGTSIFDTRGNGAALANPATDIANPAVVDPMVATIPTDPLLFINPSGTTGDLVSTVLGSAEVVAGKTTYTNSFNLANTLVQAREFPIHETSTTGGFTPTEFIHYADFFGLAGEPSSGLTNVVTRRDFELALIDTNRGVTGTLESGATDDFGLVVEVGQTHPGASVVPGEFIFLSMMGGLEGSDVDTLDVPPHGNMTSVIYLDLGPLDSVIGVKTVTRLFVVDGSGNGEVDIMEVVALPEPHAPLTLLMGAVLLSLMARRRGASLAPVHSR